MVVVDGRARKILGFFFYLSQEFSGSGSFSNIVRPEFDKVGGRNSVLRSAIPDLVLIMSDDEYGGGGGGDYDYGGPRYERVYFVSQPGY